MSRIVIVDDESIFRKGLRKMIAELDPQWEVVGEARDGYEALQLVEEQLPDAVLTDIRMPRMNGIQLQQLLRERFRDMLCVVISGFDDFIYIQQSMRQGAMDYLMKPIEREELGKVLSQLREKVQVGQRLQADPANAVKSHREEHRIKQHVSEHLITALLRGSVNDADLELLQSIGIVFQHPYFACMVIKLDKSSIGSERYNRADPSLFQLYIQQLVQEVLSRRVNGYCFVMSETEVAALINIPDRGQAMVDIREIGESIRRQMTSLSNITVTIGIGQAVEGFKAIAESYNEAEIALLHRLIIGGDKVIAYGEITRDDRLYSELSSSSWELLEQAVHNGKRELVAEAVQTFVSELCSKAYSPEVVHQQLCKLLLHYYETAGKLGITKEWLGSKDMKAVLFHICSISSREELMEACSLLLVRLAACIAENVAKPERDPIEKSIRYIEQNYANALTLKEVADAVYLNAAYFSTLFKQRMGKSFIERLTEVRIQEAKRRMAQTDQKIAAIAEHTGFANIRHFNRVFKNETGMSPKHYRDQLQAEANSKIK
ncbi:response regulator [Paenibacillus sp. 2TAB23]|uniref:response regulator n=1 Tax=Paenibacillus sp. 2TAB23 TaxID=3233004 RepID=UPI003F9431A8